MPEILVGKTREKLRKLKIRKKRGEVEELKGAFGEPVFIRKSAGDFSPAMRSVREALRRRRAKKRIKEVRKERILLT